MFCIRQQAARSDRMGSAYKERRQLSLWQGRGDPGGVKELGELVKVGCGDLRDPESNAKRGGTKQKTRRIA